MGGTPAFSPIPSPSSYVDPTTQATASIKRPTIPKQTVRRQPVILKDNGLVTAGRKQRCADLAGETAASCAAVCCCCSCGLLDFLVLAIVRAPAGLCRKAIRRRKMNLMMMMKKKKTTIDNTQESTDAFLLEDFRTIVEAETAAWHDRTASEEIIEMDREMWERFSATGFWRSPSQKDS